jgi:hypothetical protein
MADRLSSTSSCRAVSSDSAAAESEVRSCILGTGVADWTLISGPELDSADSGSRVVGIGERLDCFRSIRSLPARFRAAAWGPVWKPRLVSPASLGSEDFHRLQPSKSISAWEGISSSRARQQSYLTCIQPHSTIFFSSHLSDTGLVRKSLHPAANAATL